MRQLSACPKRVSIDLIDAQQLGVVILPRRQSVAVVAVRGYNMTKFAVLFGGAARIEPRLFEQSWQKTC